MNLVLVRRLLSATLLFALCAAVPLCAEDKPPASHDPRPSEDPEIKKELFTGKVVFLLDAFKKRGIRANDEVKDQIVLETESGELIPIVPDWRGRAFYQDKRLRDRKVELVAYRQEGVPYLQVLIVFLFDEQGQRQYMDYWCEICSIPMYEIKPCDCCQGDIDFRLQPRELPDYLKILKPQPAR